MCLMGYRYGPGQACPGFPPARAALPQRNARKRRAEWAEASSDFLLIEPGIALKPDNLQRVKQGE